MLALSLHTLCDQRDVIEAYLLSTELSEEDKQQCLLKLEEIRTQYYEEESNHAL